MPISTTTGQVATAATNEVTGARLVSRAPSEEYKSGWDRIFGNKDTNAAEEKPKTEPQAK